MKLKDKVALLTGAGSGIGRHTAYALAKEGCHLALVDFNEENLAETAAEAAKLGVQVSQHPLDVTDETALAALPKDYFEQHEHIDILINNAGIATGGTFEETSEENFNRVMAVNFHAVVQLTRLFLPHMKNRPEGRLVYISSLFGLITPPEQTAYSASKFAVRGFANSLRFELEDTPVGVTVVHPGGVSTNIADAATTPEGVSKAEIEERREKLKKLLKMPPAKAGRIIVRGIRRNRARVLVGSDAKAGAFLERLLPVSYWSIVKRLVDV